MWITSLLSLLCIIALYDYITFNILVIDLIALMLFSVSHYLCCKKNILIPSFFCIYMKITLGHLLKMKWMNQRLCILNLTRFC